jgi:hypothetical protein
MIRSELMEEGASLNWQFGFQNAVAILLFRVTSAFLALF